MQQNQLIQSQEIEFQTVVDIIIDEGQQGIESSFDSVGRFNEYGIAIVRHKESTVYETESGFQEDIEFRYGLINRAGDILLEPIYYSITEYNEHYYEVRTSHFFEDYGEMSGLVSVENGAFVLEAIYRDIPQAKENGFAFAKYYTDKSPDEVKERVLFFKDYKLIQQTVPLVVDEIDFDFMDAYQYADDIYAISGAYLEHSEEGSGAGSLARYVSWIVDKQGKMIDLSGFEANKMIVFNNDVYTYTFEDYVDEDNITREKTNVYVGSIVNGVYEYALLLEDLVHFNYKPLMNAFEYKVSGEDVIKRYSMSSKESIDLEENGESQLNHEMIASNFFEGNENVRFEFISKWKVTIAYLQENNNGVSIRARLFDELGNDVLDKEYRKLSYREELEWIAIEDLYKDFDTEGKVVEYPLVYGHYNLVTKELSDPKYNNFDYDSLTTQQNSIIQVIQSVSGLYEVCEDGAGYGDVVPEDVVIQCFTLPTLIEKLGLINNKGQIVLPAEYDHVSEFNSDGFAYFRNDVVTLENEFIRQMGLFHRERGVVLPLSFSGFETPGDYYNAPPNFDRHGHLKIYNYDDNGFMKVGLINENGIIFDVLYDQVYFLNNYFYTNIANVWKVYDDNLNLIHEFDLSFLNKVIFDIELVANGIKISGLNQQFYPDVAIYTLDLKPYIPFGQSDIQFDGQFWYLQRYNDAKRAYEKAVLDIDLNVVIDYDNDYDSISDYIDGYAIAKSGEASIEPTLSRGIDIFSVFFKKVSAITENNFKLDILDQNGEVVGDVSNKYTDVFLLGQQEGVSKALVSDGQKYYLATVVTSQVPVQSEVPSSENELEQDNEEETAIKEENDDKPQSEGSDKLPNTGQQRRDWLFIALISGLGLISIARKKRVKA